MQLSIALLSLALAAFVRADEPAKVDTDTDKDVPAELSRTVETNNNKVEFCQNYLGWVKKETKTVFDYYTKTHTDYDWDVATKVHTKSKGTKVITKDAVTVWKTKTKTPYPAYTTKTYTDTKWKHDSKWVTKTVTVRKPWGKPHHHKRGDDHDNDYDWKRGPDVHKWQRYHVSKACYKILKHVNPKTRTYTVTTTVKKPTWVKTVITKTRTVDRTVTVPKHTSYVTPVVKKYTTTWLPRVTITKKAYTKVYKTYTKTYTKTVTVTKRYGHHDNGHKGGKDGKDGKDGKY